MHPIGFAFSLFGIRAYSLVKKLFHCIMSCHLHLAMYSMLAMGQYSSIESRSTKILFINLLTILRGLSVVKTKRVL